MRDYLSLFVNGNCVHVVGEQVFMTLSEFLRTELRLIGTKIVCAEGDCGACSVLVGRASKDSRTFVYHSIDSCIVFMHQLDRTHVISVEGLGAPNGGKLSAVQDAMVRCHGSQCGFCTPGFVVAIHGLLEEKHVKNCDTPPDSLDDDTLRIGLSGNLCRCTGYAQIIEAGKSVVASEVEPLNDQYPPRRMLNQFAKTSGPSVRIEVEDRVLLMPSSLAEAIELKSANPEARIVSGATDVGVWYSHGRPSAAVSIGLTGIDPLSDVHDHDTEIVMGAGTNWTRLIDTLSESFPQFVEILHRFGSPQIRNLGTIGGNLVNASPIADSIPFLMVVDATLNLVSVRGMRSVPINEFYLGYKQTDLQPDELVESIVCPKLVPNQILKLEKISKRRDMDISTFTAAILLTFDDQVVTAARVALGGVGPVVLRTPFAEKSLIGKPFTIKSMRAAGRIARDEISAISDVRGSAAYRGQLAENIFVKWFYDCESANRDEVTV